MVKLYIFILAVLMIPVTGSAAVSIYWSNALNGKLYDRNYDLLSGGSTSVHGDGTAVQMGFHSASSSASPFAGDWMQLGVITIGGYARKSADAGLVFFGGIGAGSKK